MRTTSADTAPPQDQSNRRWDIGPIRSLEIVVMPQLAHHVAAYPGALDNVSVLYINHGISDALMVARGLRRIGARLTNVVIPYHRTNGSTQQAIRSAFQALGPTFAPEQPVPGSFAAVMRATVKEAVEQVTASARRLGRPWLIVEDGGYAFPLLHDDPELRQHLRTCLGSVEHTTRGRWNYEYGT